MFDWAARFGTRWRNLRWQQRYDRIKDRNALNEQRLFFQKKHPTEEEHRSNEQAYWNRRIDAQNRPSWIAIATLGASLLAALCGVVSFVEAGYQAIIARNAYIASNRAWLDVAVNWSKVSFLWNDEGGPKVKLDISVVNKGHSPALHFIAFPRIIARHTLDVSKIPEVEAACRISDLDLYIERVLFMDETSTQEDTGAYMSKEDAAYYKEALKDPQSHPLSDGLPFVIRVIACVSYRIIGDDKIHYTARVYRIGKLIPQSNGVLSWAPAPIWEDIPEGHVALQEDQQGNYAE